MCVFVCMRMGLWGNLADVLRARTHLVAAAVAERVVLVLRVAAVGDAIADALNRNAIAIVAREFDVFEAVAPDPRRLRKGQ